jgi:proline iminopeptidase
VAGDDREPFERGTLEVGNGHVLSWEQYGARHGVPVVYLHGGPGSGCTPGIRSAFDAAVHRAVLFDQRASGRSTPHASQAGVDWASIDMNHHVADIEALRTHLDIDRWIVFGVSWGSVLGATYAERHPDRVLGIVLGAVSLGRAEDIDWLTVHAGRFFPAQWRAFREHVPEPLRGQRLVDAYYTLLMDPDPALAEIITSAHRLAGIPGYLVQGRLDLSGPLDGAWLLNQAWAGSNLVIVEKEGHSGANMFSHWTRALAELAANQTVHPERVATTRRVPGRRP